MPAPAHKKKVTAGREPRLSAGAPFTALTRFLERSQDPGSVRRPFSPALPRSAEPGATQQTRRNSARLDRLSQSEASSSVLSQSPRPAVSTGTHRRPSEVTHSHSRHCLWRLGDTWRGQPFSREHSAALSTLPAAAYRQHL